MDFYVTFKDLNEYQRKSITKKLACLQGFCATEPDHNIQESYKQVMHSILNQTRAYLDEIVETQRVYLYGHEFDWIKLAHDKINGLN